MKNSVFHISVLVFAVFFSNQAGAQKADLNGQAAGWFTVNHSGTTNFQPGVRFVPQFTFEHAYNNKGKIEGELSADGFASYTFQSDGYRVFDGNARLYRAWVRYSSGRFEIRGGLQKINFGSANILRPLMWFDRVDPRDPLKLTAGVTGIMSRYYFRNNANIWIWGLVGNDKSKGWESVPSSLWRPEIGGRLQLPYPKGEIAFTWHNREGRFADGSAAQLGGAQFFNENRFGIDTKVDLGVGLWAEGTVAKRSNPFIPDYEKAFTVGADFTFGIGQGLNVMAENMFISTSESFLASDNSLSLTGLSLSLPLTAIIRANVIFFYDWKNSGLYNFANLTLSFNRFTVNVIAFHNPDNFAVLSFGSGRNLFSGYGGQLMAVYNF
jgi:hypothetical protein